MDDKSSLILKAEELQKEAYQILSQLGLLEILKELSQPKIVGSVASGLLVAQDIDIHAYVESYEIQKIVNLLPRLALLPTILKVQFNNYRELRRDYRKDRIKFPHAYYVGLRSLQPSGEWKIDIWFAKKGEVDEFTDARLENLSDEQKELILHLKEAWSAPDGYRDGATGVDFYKAVLDAGVKNEEDFKKYLKNKE